jgi:hypothetical protein
MFVCSICGKLSKRGETATRILTCIRRRAYDNKTKISYGWEIINEGVSATSHNHTLIDTLLAEKFPFPFSAKQPLIIDKL